MATERAGGTSGPQSGTKSGKTVTVGTAGLSLATSGPLGIGPKYVSTIRRASAGSKSPAIVRLALLGL